MLRTHPVIGLHILPNIKFLIKAARIELHHHERYNGKGYAELQGEEIELEARILTAVEAVEDIVSGAQPRIGAGIVSMLQEIKEMYGIQF